MFRECSRQKAEIQLLEQVLRRAEHQLRNPLALISLYSENLCRGLQSGGLQEQATIIRETVDDLSANLTDLVYCGQQAKLRVAPYDLREILADSIQGLRPWLEEKQVDICYPDKPVIVAVDRWQMKQVFDNLLSNAIHFSPEGGVVTCNWQVFAMEVIVEVSDRGSGLSQEDLKQVFTPFYSKRPGGTGLGLAIAKKIIFDHKGSIWVENLSVGGAQFSFILPRNN
jgi:signal transduction histidine kinase